MATPVGRVTRGVILRQALQRAGNEQLLVASGTDPALARVKLNRILDTLYNQWDWPFLYTSATVTITGDRFALPTDYLTAEDDFALSWVLEQQRCFAAEVDRATFELRSRQTSLTRASGPEIWTADRVGGYALVWPLPESPISATLRYKQLPADLDPTDTATYDADIPLFPWSDLLMDMVYQWALEYDHNPRAVLQQQQNDEALMRIRGTALPHQAKASTLPLDPQVFSAGYPRY